MLFRSDRKSTRLNSSHLVISYAVFCLKKKKTTRISTRFRNAWPVYSKLPAGGAEHARRQLGHYTHLFAISILFFFFKDPAPPEIYPLPLPDPLPILSRPFPRRRARAGGAGTRHDAPRRTRSI